MSTLIVFLRCSLYNRDGNAIVVVVEVHHCLHTSKDQVMSMKVDRSFVQCWSLMGPVMSLVRKRSSAVIHNHIPSPVDHFEVGSCRGRP